MQPSRTAAASSSSPPRQRASLVTHGARCSTSPAHRPTPFRPRLPSPKSPRSWPRAKSLSSPAGPTSRNLQQAPQQRYSLCRLHCPRQRCCQRFVAAMSSAQSASVCVAARAASTAPAFSMRRPLARSSVSSWLVPIPLPMCPTPILLAVLSPALDASLRSTRSSPTRRASPMWSSQPPPTPRRQAPPPTSKAVSPRWLIRSPSLAHRAPTGWSLLSWRNCSAPILASARSSMSPPQLQRRSMVSKRSPLRRLNQQPMVCLPVWGRSMQSQLPQWRLAIATRTTSDSW